jgi:hypothetical protein
MQVKALPATLARHASDFGRNVMALEGPVVVAAGAEGERSSVVVLDAAAGSDSTVAFSEAGAGASGLPAVVTAVAVLPGGASVAVANAEDCAVSLHALPDLRYLAEVCRPSLPVRALAASADGRYL